MFCIINLSHNSRYVAPPAAGGPPFFSAHAPPYRGGICVFTDSLIREATIRDSVSPCIVRGAHYTNAKYVTDWKSEGVGDTEVYIYVALEETWKNGL